mmetsp:Transcript_100014/g.305731  ORF Transcript_100014/g.305731 Transcript_100014/m.305731 type:complete len:286 (-) Transcript_100014:12-869(-)
MVHLSASPLHEHFGLGGPPLQGLELPHFKIRDGDEQLGAHGDDLPSALESDAKVHPLHGAVRRERRVSEHRQGIPAAAQGASALRFGGRLGWRRGRRARRRLVRFLAAPCTAGEAPPARVRARGARPRVAPAWGGALPAAAARRGRGWEVGRLVPRGLRRRRLALDQHHRHQHGHLRLEGGRLHWGHRALHGRLLRQLRRLLRKLQHGKLLPGLVQRPVLPLLIVLLCRHEYRCKTPRPTILMGGHWPRRTHLLGRGICVLRGGGLHDENRRHGRCKIANGLPRV